MAVSTDRRQGVNSSAAVKVPCRVATTAAITLSGLQTIDGVALAADDRVLVKNQSTASENGIYLASSSTWQRAPDCDGTFDLKSGTLVRVNSGSTNGSAWFSVTTADPITIGTTSLAFSSSATTPFDSSLASFINSPTGSVTRTVQDRMRDTVHLSDFLGSGTYTQAWQAAVASGAKKLYVDIGGTLTSQIDIPTQMWVYSDMAGSVAIGKGFNGDMFTLAAYSVMFGLYLIGNGATWTGRGVVISGSTSDQRIRECTISDCNGYCIEFTAVNAGSRASIAHCFLQRTTASNAAIGMPSGESLTDGTRYISDIFTGGGALIDLNGSNMTFIDMCNCTDVNFTSTTKQVYISNSRLAVTTLTIDGPSAPNITHCAIGGDIVIAGTCAGAQLTSNNVAGSLTLNSSAQNVRADDSNNFQGGVVDNSGNATNHLDAESDVTLTIGADTGTPTVGNGTLVARAVRRGKLIRVEAQLVCGSTTDLGTSGLFFSMPSGWAQNVKATSCKGAVYAVDSGTGIVTGVTRVGAGAAPKIYFGSNGAASAWNKTIPITWTTNDVIEFEAEWEIG